MAGNSRFRVDNSTRRVPSASAARCSSRKSPKCAMTSSGGASTSARAGPHKSWHRMSSSSFPAYTRRSRPQACSGVRPDQSAPWASSSLPRRFELAKALSRPRVVAQLRQVRRRQRREELAPRPDPHQLATGRRDYTAGDQRPDRPLVVHRLLPLDMRIGARTVLSLHPPVEIVIPGFSKQTLTESCCSSSSCKIRPIAIRPS